MRNTSPYYLRESRRSGRWQQLSSEDKLRAEEKRKSTIEQAEKLYFESKAKFIAFYKEQNTSIQGALEDFLVDQINNKNSNFLHHLASSGEKDFFQKLLNKGAYFDNRDQKYGATPLHIATFRRKYNIMELILGHDNNHCIREGLPTKDLEMYQKDNKGYTPISIAEGQGDLRSITLFQQYKKSFLLSQTSQKTKFYDYGTDVACTEFQGLKYEWISSPTGQIVEVLDDSGERIINRFCSGFNIGNQYYLTAGHCVDKVVKDLKDSKESTCEYPDVPNYRVSFNYQYPTCRLGEIKESTYRIESVIEHGNCCNLYDAKQTCYPVDYAIFKLEPDAEKYFGTLNITTELPEIKKDRIALAHHPMGMPKKISIGIVNSVEDPQIGTLTHTAPTINGSSGAPCGNEKTEEVFAVHIEHKTAVSISKIAEKSAQTKSGVVPSLLQQGLFNKISPVPLFPLPLNYNLERRQFRRG